ncbi:MAG TPA: bifunctional nuclease family protein [Firmicutes bacterium]|nr:bifunctional nuclease family protein [Bacillota bacterium]
MIKMDVKTVTADHGGNFLILLMDEEEKKVLPISIGPLEAQAIALVLQGEAPPRPLTHDLLKSVCERLGAAMEKVVITDIRESTFYAEIYFQQNGETLVVDSRPSDAIALALRFEAPIYMETKLIEFTYDYQDIIAKDGGEEELH